MSFFVASLLFLSLAVLILQPFQLRLSLLAFIVITHVNLSGANFDSVTTVGWENAIKSIIFPVLLLARLLLHAYRQQQLAAIIRLSNHAAVTLWLAFCVYVCASVLWSPYPLSGVKLVAAFASHSIVFFMFAAAWMTGFMQMRTVLYALVAALLIALVQTYVTGAEFDPGGGRLTSFVGPQAFAQFMVIAVSLLLWAPGYRPGFRAVLLASLGLILAINGSRSAGMGAVAMVMVWIVWMHGRQRVIALTAVGLAAGLLVASLAYIGVSETNRFVELSRAVGGDNKTIVRDVGTFRWRAGMYREAWAQLSRFDSVDRIFGRGASSGALVGRKFDARYRGSGFSPNRVIHNEFMRTYYEFGVVWGTLMLLVVLWGIATSLRLSFLTSYRRREQIAPWVGPLISIFPLMILVLTFENIFIGSSLPAPTAFLLVLARAAVSPYRLTAGH